MKRKAAAKRAGRPTSAIVRHYLAGASLEELKKKFGIRGKSQLATAVLDSLIKAGKMPPLVRKKSKADEKPKEFKVSVNKRGTVILPKEAVIDTFKATEGQSYSVKRRGRKIVLTQLG